MMAGETGQVLRREMAGALARLDLAFHIAWTDTRARYRRSVLGPFWLVLGTLIGVGGLGLVWGTLFDVEREVFIPSLSIGLVVWYLLSASITEGAAVFYTNRELVLNLPVSSLLVSLLLLARQLINFAHNFVVVAVVLMIFPRHLGWTALWALPGFVLVAFTLLGLIQLLGYLGARFRDLAPLLVALMQPLFFVTPVLFRPHQLGGMAFLVELNPLAHLLALIRAPLMGEVPGLFSWVAAAAFAAACWALALWLTARKRHRLPYWVN